MLKLTKARSRIGTALVTLACVVGVQGMTAAPAAAHARCDGQTHTHWWGETFSGHRYVWHPLWDGYFGDRGHMDVYARSSWGGTDRKHCYW